MARNAAGISPQKKALARHRADQRKRGIVRLEVAVPKTDRELLVDLAESLRSGGEAANRVRLALRTVLQTAERASLKEMLETAPFADLEFERSADRGREIGL